MSLSSLIANSNKEIAGSRTKNRLTVQISYAIQLIMEYYPTDYIIMMDYIEDVSVIRDPENPTAIHLYQVKTKTSDKQYALSAVIKDEWFQKLYANSLKYNGYLESASLVCNTGVVASNNEVFPNEKTSLDEASIQSNIKKIRSAIAKDLSINEKDVDLSKFYFVKSTLSTKGHKEEVEHQFENFLLKKDSNLQVATAKSIYSVIYDELDKKFNNEINEKCTDINEIFQEKGVFGNYIKDVITCGLAIQMPTIDQLYRDFNISSILEKRKYSKAYTQIKMDMYSDVTSFIEMKRQITELIDLTNRNGIDNMSDLLNSVYQSCLIGDQISPAYSEEFYLKMLIMILINKYCCGDENI